MVVEKQVFKVEPFFVVQKLWLSFLSNVGVEDSWLCQSNELDNQPVHPLDDTLSNYKVARDRLLWNTHSGCTIELRLDKKTEPLVGCFAWPVVEFSIPNNP